jgi:hypothetical protein
MTESIDSHQDEPTSRAIEQTRAFMASRPVPDMTDAVMRRIATLGVHPAKPSVWNASGRLIDRIWAPRRIELAWRPAYGLIAAAAVLLLLIFLPYGWRTPSAKSPVLAAAATQPRLFVQFRLDAADAMDVRLAGSFTDWQPRYELHQASPGVWTITLPLNAGVHDYVFLVNGERWVADPYAQQIDDGFGGVNSRIALVQPDAPRL